MEGNALDQKGLPRQGWHEQFIEMHENGDDRLLFDDVFEDETLEVWTNDDKSSEDSND